MSEPIIQIENVGKAYRLGQVDVRHAMFRDVVLDLFKAPIRRLKQFGQPAKGDDLFWALRKVSFDVQRGEVVGIIGRNGAGKSTLLKILSRITEPTEGQVTLSGRVASLLEVGTGFHPELTGRENIYLNGTILGMTKAEIAKKFEEIVTFAEIEKFLDTPVKRYSSGMYVRLAFAVAAHLEPEILIVDEVLAVGDAAFQAKCIGKMKEVSQGDGRTVLFVSHNMAAVTRLCSRAVLLDAGSVVVDTSAEEAAALYTSSGRSQDTTLTSNGAHLRLTIVDDDGAPATSWAVNQKLNILIQIDTVPARCLAVDIALYSELGVRVFSVQTDRMIQLRGDPPRAFRLTLTNIGLACNELWIDVGIREPGSAHYVAWWQAVANIAVSARNRPDITAAPYLIDLPCAMEAL